MFTCITEGSPLPNVTWYRNSIQVTTGEGVTIEEMESKQKITSYLVIEDVTRANDGVYWCNATNFRFVVFEAMSPTFSLSVFCKDLILASKHNFNVFLAFRSS